MECRDVFGKPMPQNIRIGSDEEFWSRVFFQLSKAEESYSRRLQKVVNTLNNRLGNDKISKLQERSKEFDNLILHIETFKDHIISQRNRTLDAMENNRNTSLELRRASNNQLDKTVHVVDSTTIDGLTKELKKKEKEVEKSKASYFNEMAAVERTKVKMLRLGYNKSAPNTSLEKHERQARDARVRYRHATRQAENQIALLMAAASQCERDWKETEAEKTRHVLNMIDTFLKVNCHTCYESKEILSGFIDVPKLVSVTMERVALPIVDFEDYDMPLLRLVMTKLKSQLIENTQCTDLSSGYFDYDPKKVRYCHVTKTHSDKKPHFLSLKKDTLVTELVPPTSAGWAFGEVWELQNKKISFGFFNTDCVQYFEAKNNILNATSASASGMNDNFVSCCPIVAV